MNLHSEAGPGYRSITGEVWVSEASGRKFLSFFWWTRNEKCFDRNGIRIRIYVIYALSYMNGFCRRCAYHFHSWNYFIGLMMIERSGVWKHVFQTFGPVLPHCSVLKHFEFQPGHGGVDVAMWTFWSQWSRQTLGLVSWKWKSFSVWIFVKMSTRIF